MKKIVFTLIVFLAAIIVQAQPRLAKPKINSETQVTVTSEELNATSGVTSNIQNQLNTKKDSAWINNFIDGLGYIDLTTFQAHPAYQITSGDITNLNNLSGTNSGNETSSSISIINHGATAKTTPVDADEIVGQDSENSWSLSRITWTSIKAFLKTYFDGLYSPILTNYSLINSITATDTTNWGAEGTGAVDSLWADSTFVKISNADTITSGIYSKDQIDLYVGLIAPHIRIIADSAVAWFKANDLNTVTKDATDSVSVWANKLGNGRNLTATGTAKPIWSSNGMLFNGTTSSMVTETFTLEQPTMIYIVFKQITWTSNDYIFDGYTTASGGLRQRTATPGLGIYAGASSAADNNLALDTWGIARIVFNGLNSTLQIDENAITIDGNYGSSDMNGFTLGGIAAGTTGRSNIEVKEIIIMPAKNSTTNQNIIMNYLRNEYGL
jgi:hypothetical protein